METVKVLFVLYVIAGGQSDMQAAQVRAGYTSRTVCEEDAKFLAKALAAADPRARYVCVEQDAQRR